MILVGYKTTASLSGCRRWFRILMKGRKALKLHSKTIGADLATQIGYI